MTTFAKFLQSFKNLKSDAVPQTPTFEEDLNNPSSPTVEEEEEEVNSDDNIKKEKYKKKFFFTPNFKKKKDYYGSTKDNKDPDSVVNTQATGNVINIVNSQGIHWGNVYNMGTNKPKKNPESDDDVHIEKCHLIFSLLECTSAPDHVYMDYIAKNLGKDWYRIFRCLGFSKGRIETAEIDEARNGVSEARYQLLLDWTRNDEDGSLGKLATILWDEGERQVVKQLAIIYKNRK